ncbi:hypothetical protein ACR9YC_01675 [Parasphingorhabdus sp. DH2-15]|uniref:hypothetical protein n=1 Tax=Parasphingorhabdus sp. DH2-15 TaxID=3444112 RepID=UPI003F686A4E
MHGKGTSHFQETTYPSKNPEQQTYSTATSDRRKEPPVESAQPHTTGYDISSTTKLATYLGVPIVMITIMESEDVLIYDAFGLAPGRMLGKLSRACHARCRNGAYFKSDIANDSYFSAVQGPKGLGDRRFLVGVPVYGTNNMLIGTAAILDRRRNVLIRRHLFRDLHDAAHLFITHRQAASDHAAKAKTDN